MPASTATTPIRKPTTASAIGQTHHGIVAAASIFLELCSHMPKLAANVSMLFPQLDFLDRFAAARKAGFRYVEYQFPYDHDPAEVARRVRDAGVEVVLHNLPLGGDPKVERGIACLPGREREFRDNVERGIAYAKAAGCPRLNCISGIAPFDQPHREALVANLRYAARKLGEVGLHLMLEPVSIRTVPGFILNRS